MDYVLLGQKIRAARVSAGLSQEQLAEMVGLTSQHISHTEVASTKISLPSLIKIANALHTSVDRLLSDSIHDSKSYLTEDVQAVFSDCDPDEMYVMLEAANAVKKSIRMGLSEPFKIPVLQPKHIIVFKRQRHIADQCPEEIHHDTAPYP